jgi:hypothetical protein
MDVLAVRDHLNFECQGAEQRAAPRLSDGDRSHRVAGWVGFSTVIAVATCLVPSSWYVTDTVVLTPIVPLTGVNLGFTTA